jgi:hypothetical protein
MKYAIQLYQPSGYGRIVHPLLIGRAGWRYGESIMSLGIRSKWRASILPGKQRDAKSAVEYPASHEVIPFAKKWNE